MISMKREAYKTRYVWVVLLAIILGLALTGCSTTLSAKKGNCVEVSRLLYNRLTREGKEVRIGHGYFRGDPHCWVEVKDGDRWEIQDDSIWYVGRGFTFEEHGDYKRTSYEY